MTRLVFIVEGDTEVSFVNNHIIPYLINRGFNNPANAQTIITSRRKNKKGGVLSYEYFKNDVTRVMAQGNVIITSMLDFFRLPSNFPNFSTDSSKVCDIEEGILTDLGGQNNLIPYVQLHEIEALMFSDTTGFDFVIDDAQEMAQIREIIQEYPNPEDINNSPETAPSKRLGRIFNYNKVADGELIFEALGIAKILKACPRFAEWIETIENKLREFP